MFYSPRAWVHDEKNYVANDWRHSNSWPPPGTVERKFYLTGDGRLSSDGPGGEARSYLYDPRRPVPTLGGRNMMIAVGSIDQRPVQAVPNYGLSYRSEVLEAGSDYSRFGGCHSPHSVELSLIPTLWRN